MMERNLYIGPYLACEPALLQCQVEQRACPMAGCPNHRTNPPSAFCQLCGSRIVTRITATRRAAVDTDALQVSLDNALTCLDCNCTGLEEHLWLPNKGDLGEYPSNYRQRGAWSFEPGKIEQDCTAFAAHFAPALDALRRAYGAERVSLRWGVVLWVS